MNDKLFYRSFELDRSAVNEDARSVELSFSSEAPVMRWFGQEILLHGEANVDLKRLRSMGAALFNHNPDRIVGPVDNPRIEDKRGMATVVFDEDEEGERAFGKVKSRSLRGVSVGYAINKFREVKADEEWNGIKGPAYIATRWTPYEISLTPIPADSSIGIGREMTRSLDGIEIETSLGCNKSQQEVHEMEEKEIRDLVVKTVGEALKTGTPAIVAEVRAGLAEDAKPKLRILPEKALELLGQAGAVSTELKAKVADMWAEGRTEAEITKLIIEQATGKRDANATNKGKEGDGTGLQEGKETGKRDTFERVDDDLFVRSFQNPALIAR